MRDADRSKELLRMFKAGHVWTCEKCGGTIEESNLCSDCGAVSKDAVAASGLAAYEVISKQSAAERRRTKAMALGKAESTPVTPLSISERGEAVAKVVAEGRRSALVAAKAMAFGSAESTPATPSDTRLPKRAKGSMLIEPEAEKPTLWPFPVATDLEKKAVAERLRSNRAAAKAIKLGTAEPTLVTPSDTRLPKRAKASMIIEPEAEKPTLAPPSVAPCPICGAPLRIFKRCESCHQKSQAMEQMAEQKRQEAEAQQIEVDRVLRQKELDAHIRKVEWALISVVGLVMLLILWGLVSLNKVGSKERVPGEEASAITYKSPDDGIVVPEQGVASCDVEHNGGLRQQIVTYTIGGQTYAINGQARQRASRRGWIDGKTAFTPEQMQTFLNDGLRRCTAVSPGRTSSNLETEGSRDGLRYAISLRKIGEQADGTACAVGMAVEDKNRPNLSQSEIETYSKAFANACMGHKVF